MRLEAASVNRGTEWLWAKAASTGMVETLQGHDGLPKTLAIFFPELWPYALLSASPRAVGPAVMSLLGSICVRELKQWLPEPVVGSMLAASHEQCALGRGV